MAALRATRLPRIVFTVLLLVTVAAIWACGGTAEPEQQAAAPAAAAATEAPAAAATAAPEPTAMPAMAEEDTFLHLAVTPLPQDTYLPWLATSSGHLPFRPMWENLTTISPETGVSTILPQLAREWDVSPDASEYTFYLQEGAQMHHGWGEFTVKDVIFTIDQQMSDPLAGCKAPLKPVYGDRLGIRNGRQRQLGDNRRLHL